jgi:hypothetical protein
MNQVFNDTDHLYAVLVPFFNKLKDHEEIGPKILGSGLVIQFRYSEPDAVITIDCPQKLVIAGDDEAIKPIVTMTMKANTAHKFWLGKLSLMIALAKREIIAKGPIASTMKLLPIIKGAYSMYDGYLKEIGMEQLIDFFSTAPKTQEGPKE